MVPEGHIFHSVRTDISARVHNLLNRWQFLLLGHNSGCGLSCHLLYHRKKKQNPSLRGVLTEKETPIVESPLRQHHPKSDRYRPEKSVSAHY